MIRVEAPPLPPKRYADADEALAGKCMTCGSLVSCTLRDARLASKPRQYGTWTDLVSAECPACGARVFVMPVEEFRPLASKETGL